MHVLLKTFRSAQCHFVLKCIETVQAAILRFHQHIKLFIIIFPTFVPMFCSPLLSLFYIYFSFMHFLWDFFFFFRSVLNGYIFIFFHLFLSLPIVLGFRKSSKGLATKQHF